MFRVFYSSSSLVQAAIRRRASVATRRTGRRGVSGTGGGTGGWWNRRLLDDWRILLSSYLQRVLKFNGSIGDSLSSLDDGGADFLIRTTDERLDDGQFP